MTSTGVIGRTNRTPEGTCAIVWIQMASSQDSEPRGKESIQDCLIRSEKAGRWTDNQSISILKVIFQWSPKAGCTKYMSGFKVRPDRVRIGQILTRKIANGWKKLRTCVPQSTRRTLQWSVWTWIRLCKYVCPPFVLYGLDQPLVLIKTSKEYHRLIFRVIL